MAPGLVERVSCPLSHFERTVWRHDVRRRFVKIIFAILSGCHFPHKSPWTWRSVTAMNHLPFELVSFELDWRRRCRVELLQMILMQPFFPLPSRSGFSCPTSVHQMPSPAIKDNAWYQEGCFDRCLLAKNVAATMYNCCCCLSWLKNASSCFLSPRYLPT